MVEGIPLTAPHRLFLDLAHGLGLIDLVVLGDWLVSRGLVTTDSRSPLRASTQPEDTVRRLREALASRGCRRLRIDDGWRAHFAA